MWREKRNEIDSIQPLLLSRPKSVCFFHCNSIMSFKKNQQEKTNFQKKMLPYKQYHKLLNLNERRKKCAQNHIITRGQKKTLWNSLNATRISRMIIICTSTYLQRMSLSLFFVTKHYVEVYNIVSNRTSASFLLLFWFSLWQYAFQLKWPDNCIVNRASSNHTATPQIKERRDNQNLTHRQQS